MNTHDDTIELIEASSIGVALDADVAAAIRIEIVDPRGEGAAFLLDANECLDLALRLIGAVARLRGDVCLGDLQ